jgi:hypothetical protein
VIVITLDVLAHPADELGSRQPTTEGRKLWNMLFQQYQGRICVLATGVEKQKTPILLEWLKREGFKAGTVDITYETSPDAKLERVRSIQAGYGRVEWFCDTDPATVRRVIHDGVATLLVSVPSVPRPEWVSARAIKQWDELSREIHDQALARAEREWHDE